MLYSFPMMNKIFLGLLILTPVAILAAYLSAPAIAVFLLSAAAIIPLAKFIGDAVDDLSTHSGPAIGGLLGATFGNATELIVSLFALQAGLVEVVKASITGAILGNVLLVLGTAMLLGGRTQKAQKFNITAAKTHASMLLLATVALVIPALFVFTTGAKASASIEPLSIFVSLLMIVAYMASLFFTLHTHKHLYSGIEAKEATEVFAPRWGVWTCVSVLAVATVFVAVLSEILVHSITPVVQQFGWTELFIGIIVVAIIGNVAEHLAAVTAAVKNRMDLSLHIAIGSATQIVMFVAPVLVFVSILIGNPMNLVFGTFELIAIIFSVFVTNAVIEDGESNWFEGFQLLIAYVIMAVAFFFIR